MATPKETTGLAYTDFSTDKAKDEAYMHDQQKAQKVVDTIKAKGLELGGTEFFEHKSRREILGEKLSKKILSLVMITFVTTIVTASPYFNNSVDRWESDCKYDLRSGCAIAAKMYLRGSWEDAQTGEIVKIKGSKRSRYKKAKQLFKRACDLGDNISCKEYKKIN
ncbi:hypothetical protein ACM66Z_08015 [Sulfurovum sp. ST-21]|uniref:Beta-lactamase n=1 Tax=Sulfurovum indicum TaxID=2779528 RepID=A0A7M1S6M4_9BACT|nr:hypothetical protein [Sulfurovum indicum]QOR63055.1 hypothetical protein IMZ28_08010 [Sulfurovum indicum]